MKIGLFGGSFNPVHVAHLIISDWVKEELSLDSIYLIPTALSPLKAGEPSMIEMHHRISMLRLAVKDMDGYMIKDYESEQGKVYYSVNTIEKVAKEMSLSRDDLFFIVGTDNFRIFHTHWKDPEKIASLCTIVAAKRPNEEMPATIPDYLNFIAVETPLIDISSTLIRERIKEGKSIRFMVPDEVEKYIKTNNLYGKII